MASKISVVVVDDHPMFRDGVTRTLNSASTIEVVAEGENLDDAVRLVQDLMPDVMLLDISMPGNGIVALGVIARLCPVIKIAMLTASESEDDLMKSLHAGASGYILKGVGGPQLIEIVEAVHRGESYVSPGLAARMLSELKNRPENGVDSQGNYSELTAREEQILKSVSRGLSNKEIGAELNITEKTVKHYVTNVLHKLHVRNRVEAALLYQRKEFSER